MEENEEELASAGLKNTVVGLIEQLRKKGWNDTEILDFILKILKS